MLGFSENPSVLQRKNDVISWRMSYEAWQTFNDLRVKGLFFDVRLITDDNRGFAAHRIVLCTCGHYFRYCKLQINIAFKFEHFSADILASAFFRI